MRAQLSSLPMSTWRQPQAHASVPPTHTTTLQQAHAAASARARRGTHPLPWFHQLLLCRRLLPYQCFRAKNSQPSLVVLHRHMPTEEKTHCGAESGQKLTVLHLLWCLKRLATYLSTMPGPHGPSSRMRPPGVKPCVRGDDDNDAAGGEGAQGSASRATVRCWVRHTECCWSSSAMARCGVQGVPPRKLQLSHAIGQHLQRCHRLLYAAPLPSSAHPRTSAKQPSPCPDPPPKNPATPPLAPSPRGTCRA